MTLDEQKERTRKYRRRKGRRLLPGISVLQVMLITAAVLAALAIALYVWADHMKNNGKFLPGTKVGTVDISGMSIKEASEAISKSATDVPVTVTEKGKDVFASTLYGLGFSVDKAAVEEKTESFMKEEKASIRSVISGTMYGNSFYMDIPYAVNDQVFCSAVQVDDLLQPRKKNVDAKLLYYREDKECRIQPEVQGTELTDEALQKWLEEELQREVSRKEPGEGTETITLNIPDDIYEKPKKQASDEAMQEKCRILNTVAGESVTYRFGSKEETLSFSEILNWLKVRDGRLIVKEDKVREYVEKIAEKYNTRYLERTFKTSNGVEVTISPEWNEYGYTVQVDQEVDQLVSDILSGKDTAREPVYIEGNDWGCPYYLGRDGLDDLNGTYVEVSIDDQHMWFYKGGDLVIESDVVTGDVTRGMGTAKGVFPLAYKESPSVLRGGEGRDRYETKVQYWMPFYDGEGLHDAPWNPSFGGTRYLGNGSHGCVNLPSSVAQTVYENIEPGTAIVIY